MRVAPKKAAEVDTVTIGQKAAAKARRAVSAMSLEAQQELARQGMAKLYQAAGRGKAGLNQSRVSSILAVFRLA